MTRYRVEEVFVSVFIYTIILQFAEFVFKFLPFRMCV